MAKSRAGLIKELDRVFSIWIRVRDSDSDGFIKCVSCKKSIHWKYANNCHYASRKHMATRWDEENCNAGCVYCNKYNVGFHMHHYRLFLEEKYGEGTADKLMIMSKFTVKFSMDDLKEKIEYYKIS